MAQPPFSPAAGGAKHSLPRLRPSRDPAAVRALRQAVAHQGEKCGLARFCRTDIPPLGGGFRSAGLPGDPVKHVACFVRLQFPFQAGLGQNAVEHPFVVGSRAGKLDFNLSRVNVMTLQG